MAEFIAPLKQALEQAAGPDLLPPPVKDALQHLQHLQGQLAVGFVGMNPANGEPQLVASLDFGTHVKEFAAFLGGAEARAIFEAHGFKVAGQ